ncbi:molybdenum cofactor biosynthesis protein B [bacterium]|nr:molybdenum cofactor biosynthesis protein B [bacterium]
MPQEFVPVQVAVLAVSDSRDLTTDKSGAIIADRLSQAGHLLADRAVCRDDVKAVRRVVKTWVKNPKVDFIIVTGGTGVTQRDITPDAIRPLYTKHIPGFGELFRHLSYAEIGTSTIQSRADAGLVGDTLVFVLPGSTGAVRLAMDKIILDQIDIRHRPCNFTELLPRIRHDPAPLGREKGRKGEREKGKPGGHH